MRNFARLDEATLTHVIRNHAGDLQVTSESGKGAQFAVKLPITLSDLAAAGSLPS